MTGIQKHISSIDLNNRVFASIANTSNGEVSDDTIFHYFQQDNTIWGKYAGGEIERGTLIGKFIGDCNIYFSYQHINLLGEIRSGICTSRIETLDDGRLRMYESWQWFDKDRSEGTSVIEEVVVS